MIPKIYLCNSKAGNPEHIRMVKDYLAKFQCEVIEFEGGKYTTETLDKADYFVLIPPNHDFDAGDDKVLVGKGQWTEYDHYNLYSASYIPLIVVDFQGETPIISESDTYDIIDEDWKTKYATLDISQGDGDQELATALDLVLKDVESVQESIKIEIVVDSSPKKLFKF
jgi:hypothetical protein